MLADKVAKVGGGIIGGSVNMKCDHFYISALIFVRRFVAVMLMLLVSATALQAGVFLPNERLVSDPSISMKDPEFDSVGNLMTWQDDAGNLWLADIDATTGDILPATGQGILVDTGLARAGFVGNGPEFGYGAGETFLCYTRLLSGIRHIAVARKDQFGDWVPSVQELGSDRWRPLCSLPGTPETGRMIYVSETTPGQRAVSWRVIDDAFSERTFTTVGGAGGRWTGERSFVSPGDVDGVIQLFWTDIDTEETSQMTFGAEDKINIFLWYAPEYNDLLLTAAVNYTSVGIFRRISGVWTRIYTFQLPSDFQYVSSPEAFVHNGKSYIAVIAAEELNGSGPLPNLPSGPSEVWIANIDESAPFFRRIDSGLSGVRRAEPEPFMLSTGPAVYFTETDPVSGNALLKVADTGLGSPAVGDTDSDGVSDDRDNCILTANAPQRDTNFDGIGNMCDPDINNDCLVNLKDYFILKSLLGTSFAGADMDGNGVVDDGDFLIMSPYFFSPPGPASSPNACDANL